VLCILQSQLTIPPSFLGKEPVPITAWLGGLILMRFLTHARLYQRPRWTSDRTLGRVERLLVT